VNENSFDSLADFVSYITRLEKSGFDMAAAIYVYIGIDMLCLIESGKVKQGRSDFIAWVDKYMKADPEQGYQYRGKDVYAARCAALHEYGSESDANRDDDIRKFGYTDGGRHIYAPDIDKKLVLIGIKSFIYDFLKATHSFIEGATKNKDLARRLEDKLPKILTHIPI
jgi:hypothetical protein